MGGGCAEPRALHPAPRSLFRAAADAPDAPNAPTSNSPARAPRSPPAARAGSKARRRLWAGARGGCRYTLTAARPGALHRPCAVGPRPTFEHGARGCGVHGWGGGATAEETAVVCAGARVRSRFHSWLPICALFYNCNGGGFRVARPIARFCRRSDGSNATKTILPAFSVRPGPQSRLVRARGCTMLLLAPPRQAARHVRLQLFRL